MHKYEYDVKIKCNQSIYSIVNIFGAYLTGTHSDDYERNEEFYDESYIVADYYKYSDIKFMDWWKSNAIKKDSMYCAFHCSSDDKVLTINTREKPTDEIIDVLINRAKLFYDNWESIADEIEDNSEVQVGVQIDSLKKPLEILGLTIVEHEIVTTSTETVYF
jgi:hypothetical protein